MALFKVPTRNTGKLQDAQIAKKANTKITRTATATVKGSGGIIGRISTINAMVDKYLGKYKEESIIISTKEELHDYISHCIENKVISIDTETTGLDPMLDEIAGVCLYTPGQKTAYVPINHISYITFLRVPEQVPVDDVKDELQRIADNNVPVIMFNGPFDVRFLRNQVGVYLDCWWDCSPASRLLNENEGDGNNGLKKLHQKYVLDGVGDAFKFDDLFKGIPFTQIPIKTGYLYAAHDAKITYELYKFQEPFLTDTDPKCIKHNLQKVAWVFRNIEMPMVKVIADMEDRGITFDMEYTHSLSTKYNNILQEKLDNFHNLCGMYGNEIKSYIDRTEDCKLEYPINIMSPLQIGILLYDIIKIEPPDSKNPRGTGAEILAKMDNPIPRAILEYRECAKLITTYIDKMPECVNPNDGKVHCKFNSYGAVTGRMSCISEGTKVSSPGGDKCIEELQKGDWVYCYNDKNQLTLSKVNNVWFTGIRKCVKLSWTSKYNKHLTGELICTPDHFIRTYNRGWVMAKDLTPQDSILYVHRRLNEHSVSLYGFHGQGAEEEHSWIKLNYFNVQDSTLHIHHKDYNRHNNNPDNLVVTTVKGHANIHMSDPEAHHCGAINYTLDELLNMGESVNWELSKIPHDYNTLISWYRKFKINYILKFTESFSKRNYIVRPNKKAHKALHLPLNRSNILYSLELADGDLVIAAGYFGVTLQVFEEACDKYEILSNHNITKIEYLEHPYNVYDIEVEGYHNFIANELCVHNSSNPNLQNIPSHNKDIRKMFTAQPGYLLMSSDFSQQEPKALAALCRQAGDDQMYQTFMQGKDLYSEIAAKAFNKPYDECREFRPDGTTNKEGKARRTQAKSVLLGVLYGRGEASIGEQLHVSTQKAKEIKDSVFKGFPAIKQFEQDSLDMARELGYVTTVCGRKRRLPDLQLDEFEFSWKDGCAPSDDLLDFDDEVTEVEVPEDRKRYYRQKLRSCKFWEKRKWIDKASEEGIRIIDNGGKIADATRQTVNSRIQGSAADLTKLAMIDLNNNEELNKLGFRLLIPVHDEVIAECPEENIKRCSELLAEVMCHAAEKVLDMSISCDVAISKCWYGDQLVIQEDGTLKTLN